MTLVGFSKLDVGIKSVAYVGPSDLCSYWDLQFNNLQKESCVVAKSTKRLVVT